MIALGNHDVALWLHTDANPSDEEWETGISQIAALRSERRGDLTAFRTLVVSDGGVPDSRQRAALFSLFKEPSKASLVTIPLASPFKRSIAAVFSWLNPELRAFPPARFTEALVHVDLLERQASILEEYRKMQVTLPAVETLRQAFESLRR